ncbi:MULTISPECIES: class I SAM-dependent methyltransferase [Cytobacillus]|uniref:class I SAM-dependent methyltransferase n=1 Tax=Cytobacillus TaxID=2675230 RepID=UPI00203D850D|nr:class I SAM-dependent methyltransferase [Cytobacillus firmus]MCM3706297.1 class I SAM-dependent methyltransferase [Cytobacillus firmus]
MAEKFYDELAEEYHLIFENWDRAIARQGNVLDNLLSAEGIIKPSSLLDCSCGIGTQTLALAKKGYKITASDISRKSIERAKREAEQRQLKIPFFQADMKELSSVYNETFQAILSMDNALPHLTDENECIKALKEIYSLLSGEGIFLFSIRNYDEILKERPSSTLPAKRNHTITFQLWDWQQHSDIYNLKHFTMVEKDGEWSVSERDSQYRAYRREDLNQLLHKAGFRQVKWLLPEESPFYQPIAIAYK